MLNNLLAIDTSNELCQVGLWCNGEYKQFKHSGVKQHAKVILSSIDQLLAEAAILPNQLDGIVYGKGPGSFTGIRIAACITQGLASAHDIPVYGISSLKALAYNSFQLFAVKHIWVINDARMKEVYHARFTYNNHIIEQHGLESVSSITDIHLDASHDWLLVGSGLSQFDMEIKNSVLSHFRRENNFSFSTLDLFKIALQDIDAFKGNNIALPSYIRNQVTHQ